MSEIIFWDQPNTKQRVISALQNNDILITTTDTIPGFLANTTQNSFENLNQIKVGRQAKPYIILISAPSKLDNFIDTDQLQTEHKNLITKCWPGPLTIIFKAKKELPVFLKSGQDTVAIRCPAYPDLLEILKHFDGLFSTSANTSAVPAPKDIQEVAPDVAKQVKYLVDDPQSPVEQASHAPSTIIDVSTRQVILIRHGAISQQALEKILGKQIENKAK